MSYARSPNPSVTLDVIVNSVTAGAAPYASSIAARPCLATLCGGISVPSSVKSAATAAASPASRASWYACPTPVIAAMSSSVNGPAG